jgi:hypothetical protein
MNDIIYFNGDSWTENFVFKRALKEILPTNYLVINNATSGNWNKQIIKETVDDLTQLSAWSPTATIHAFIFLSEWLRSPHEIDIVKVLVKRHGTVAGVNLILSELANLYVNQLKNKISTLPNVKLHVSTAFVDTAWETDMLPMYKIVMDNLNLKTHGSLCYSVSYINKFSDQELLNLGFNKYQINDFVTNVLNRCMDLETIPSIIRYHLADHEQYKNIAKEIKKLL